MNERKELKEDVRRYCRDARLSGLVVDGYIRIGKLRGSDACRQSDRIDAIWAMRELEEIRRNRARRIRYDSRIANRG